jgi:hypothetical protein
MVLQTTFSSSDEGAVAVAGTPTEIGALSGLGAAAARPVMGDKVRTAAIAK